MPQYIPTIDEIAREKQKDVLWVFFDIMNCMSNEYRSALIEWLDVHEIHYEKAGAPSGSGWLSYNGSLWIDLPIDTNHQQYRLLCDRLESSDGVPKSPDVILFIVKLNDAMEAKRDELF